MHRPPHVAPAQLSCNLCTSCHHLRQHQQPLSTSSLTPPGASPGASPGPLPGAVPGPTPGASPAGPRPGTPLGPSPGARYPSGAISTWRLLGHRPGRQRAVRCMNWLGRPQTGKGSRRASPRTAPGSVHVLSHQSQAWTATCHTQ